MEFEMKVADWPNGTSIDEWVDWIVQTLRNGGFENELRTVLHRKGVEARIVTFTQTVPGVGEFPAIGISFRSSGSEQLFTDYRITMTGPEGFIMSVGKWNYFEGKRPYILLGPDDGAFLKKQNATRVSLVIAE